ncbi:hypothetical protein BaRGS_00030237, partial [Batillaria attramentaria]
MKTTTTQDETFTYRLPAMELNQPSMIHVGQVPGVCYCDVFVLNVRDSLIASTTPPGILYKPGNTRHMTATLAGET